MNVLKSSSFALVLLLAACGQSTSAPAPVEGPVEAPAAETPDLALHTGGPCRVLSGDLSETGMESHGTAAGYSISATPRTLACSEPGLEGAVECAATGPGEIHVTAQDTGGFALDAGQSGTLVVGPDGAACYLSASGG